MSWIENISSLIWVIELSFRQFFSVFADFVDYQSLIYIGELLIVVWVIGIISRIRVKPKEIDTIIKVEKRIKE